MRARAWLVLAALLCFLFMLAEIVGGLLAHSLAVMTDAAHMLSDVAGCARLGPSAASACASAALLTRRAAPRRADSW